MPGRRSAGLILWRRSVRSFEVLLAHMGGPLWAKRDERAWSIPKGEYDEAEDPLDAARREFAEELGHPAPPGDLLALGDVRQSGGKTVTAWALEGDLDASSIVSNTVTMPWPPRSGRVAEFPEVDRAAWFPPEVARTKLVTAQAAFVDRLEAALGGARD